MVMRLTSDTASLDVQFSASLEVSGIATIVMHKIYNIAHEHSVHKEVKIRYFLDRLEFSGSENLSVYITFENGYGADIFLGKLLLANLWELFLVKDVHLWDFEQGSFEDFSFIMNFKSGWI